MTVKVVSTHKSEISTHKCQCDSWQHESQPQLFSSQGQVDSQYIPDHASSPHSMICKYEYLDALKKEEAHHVLCFDHSLDMFSNYS